MTKAFDHALCLLSRREHSAVELYKKLKQKGFNEVEVQEALNTCQELDLQNDHRFVAVYVQSRIRQGYGPLKISQELYNKGISNDLIQIILQQEDKNWFAYALDVWQKKSKGRIGLSLSERQKQQRFLLYRGFGMDVVAKVTKELGL